MTQPVLTPFHQHRPKFLLGDGGGLSLQRHPFDCFAPGIVLDGDPGHKFAIAPPQSTNCVLAIVQDFGVSIAS